MYLFLLIEIIFLLILIKKRSLTNPIVVGYFILFFYFNSVYIDYIFFGQIPEKIGLQNIDVDFNSLTFLKYSFISFLLLLFFFIFTIKEKNIPVNYLKTYNIKSNNKYLTNFLLILLITYNFYSIINSFALTRAEQGLNQTPLILLSRNFVNYSFILFFNLKIKKNFLLYIFYISTVFYFFYSFEREPLVILFLSVLYKSKKLSKPIIFFISSAVLVFLLSIWKIFYTTFLYSTGRGQEAFVNYLDESDFSFSGIDPQASFLLVYDYLKEPTIMYGDYYFSYITGTYNQFERMIFHTDYITLAEYASNSYTGGDYGLAFSILLEGLLNLWYFFPIFLAYLISKTLTKSLKLQYFYGTGIIVSFLYILMKFMRTEFATLIKLQVVPLLLSILLIKILFKYEQKKN